MSDYNNDGDSKAANPTDDDQIATLLRLAGRRPAVEQDRAARVRNAVHEAWQEQTAGRSRRRWLSAAAAVVVLLMAGVIAFRASRTTVTPAPSAIVATVEAYEGAVAARQGEASSIINVGSPLRPDQILETADGASASLRWGKATLRVDGGSMVRFESPRAVTLQKGAVYFAGGHTGVVINTPFGQIHDIGTQFEVRLAADFVRVRVREGRVELDRNGVKAVAEAGTELSAHASGAVARRAIPPFGEEWAWIARAAPPVALEGQRLNQIIESIAAEKGLTVAWSKDVPRNVELHGSTPLSVDEALVAALSATGLESRVDGATLFIDKGRR